MNNVTFMGGETTGSIAKRQLNTAPRNEVPRQIETLEQDTVNFRGHEDKEKKSSTLGKIAILATTAALIFGGLGYAHKAGWVEKLGEGKIKDFVNTVTEPCHDGCRKIKGWTNDGWTWVKNLFGGKKEA